jgi:hypothetical protein
LLPPKRINSLYNELAKLKVRILTLFQKMLLSKNMHEGCICKFSVKSVVPMLNMALGWYDENWETNGKELTICLTV